MFILEKLYKAVVIASSLLLPHLNCVLDGFMAS
jgi:hypothetical protein